MGPALRITIEYFVLLQGENLLASWGWDQIETKLYPNHLSILLLFIYFESMVVGTQQVNNRIIKQNNITIYIYTSSSQDILALT